MTDFDSILRTQDEIRTVVNAVLCECWGLLHIIGSDISKVRWNHHDAVVLVWRMCFIGLANPKFTTFTIGCRDFHPRRPFSWFRRGFFVLLFVTSRQKSSSKREESEASSFLAFFNRCSGEQARRSSTLSSGRRFD